MVVRVRKAREEERLNAVPFNGGTRGKNHLRERSVMDVQIPLLVAVYLSFLIYPRLKGINVAEIKAVDTRSRGFKFPVR